MVSAQEATPLWISPLLKCAEVEPETGHYEVLHRLISQSPNPDHPDSEIETALELYVGPDGMPLWRRVVVRSGPACPKRVVHASFMLPTDDGPVPMEQGKSSSLCWTAFPDRPDHQLLCVLASPTLLCIWDAYPRGSETSMGGEGQHIPLPFEASGVHAIGGRFGLLLQRAETVEDHLDVDTRSWQQTALQGEDDEEGFVLKPPPRPVRTSIDTLNVSTTTAGVPSLFSLSHPLDDILPVSTVMPSDDLQPRSVTDAFEKVIYVGELKWYGQSGDKGLVEYSQPICVTYHSQLKRHAMWELRAAPPPPAQPPLWQASSQWRSDNGWSSHLGMFGQDLEDLELPGGGLDGADMANYNPPSRNDALADALGVRRTPRKAAEDMAPRGRNAPLRSANRGQRSKAAGGNNVSLLSPLSRPANETTHMIDIDTSVESTTKPAMLTMGPFASLFPKVSMTCLYEEPKASPEASEVFVASNLEGWGNLTVCLLCPQPTSSEANRSTLRLFPFEPREEEYVMVDDPEVSPQDGFAKKFEMREEAWVQCESAQPIEAVPVAPCFLPHKRNQKDGARKSTTDILVLHAKETGIVALSLFRGSMHVVDCALSEMGATDCHDSSPCAIQNSLGNRFDLVFTNASIRATLSLSMSSGRTSEHLVQALECAILTLNEVPTVSKVQIAVKLRSDCIRLEQALRMPSDGRQSSTADPGISAVNEVISALFRLELLGENVNKKMGTAQTPTIDSSWDQLLQSGFHHGVSVDCSDFVNVVARQTHVPMERAFTLGSDTLSSIHSFFTECVEHSKVQLASVLFHAIHTVYEDYKLHVKARDLGLHSAGSILAHLCSLISSLAGSQASVGPYLEHYRQDLGDNFLHETKNPKENVFQEQTESAIPAVFTPVNLSPPCVLSWIDSVVLAGEIGTSYSETSSVASNAACFRTDSIIRIYGLLYPRADCTQTKEDLKDHVRRDFAVVRALIENGFKDQESLRDDLPAGVVLPLLEVLHRCRRHSELDDLSPDDADMWSLIGRDDLFKNSMRDLKGREESGVAIPGTTDKKQRPSTAKRAELEDKDKDGVSPLEVTSSMLFPDDNRIREVGRLLRSARPVYLNVPRPIELSDHDYERAKQEQLLLLSRRILALPVGRGMFTIGNLQPVPAEPLPLPDLCLVGRVPPTNAMLALDTAECPADLKVWPDFHNGVAAGLRLPLEQDAGEVVSKITRTWIVYNRPQDTEQQQPQNNQNPNTTTPQNLGHAHGGVLMALGLRGHLTTLEMADVFDYLTQGTVTTTVGVLLGMAANMRGSCDISVSKMLCLHIPSLIPQHFNAIDVASTVQAAAVSGAGLLYQKSSHRMMTEFLLNEIGKRPSNDVNVVDREAYTLSCGIALGMVNLCQGEGNGEGNSSAGLADLRIEERLYRYIVGGLDDAEMRRRRDETDRLNLPTTSAAGGSEKCACVFEGDSINSDVTSPGATLALGLIYLKSGNKTIASAIDLPDTHFLLEYVRPDFLMLRVIARALILWDDVEASKEWIGGQLPTAIQKAYDQMSEQARCLSRQAGAPSVSQDGNFDRQAVRLIYAHIVAGACFALGLRFAGTADKEAAAAIYERVMEFMELRDGVDAGACALRPPGPVLEMCLGCAALSLSMVLAGTGDLDALRLLKVLRWRCDEEVSYGSHMMYGTAIGLLFLGGGTCTLGREPEDIAALVMAFYPRYPSTTSDNQYHLQALRNLYALAVTRREIRAIDADTGEHVFVPIQLHFEESPPLNLTTPCLLSNMDVAPCELRVLSERYYPVSLSLRSHQFQKCFYVKRRSAHLSYQQDPNSQRSLLVQTGGLHGADSLDLVSTFTDDRKVLSFAKHFGGMGNVSSADKFQGPFSIEGFCNRVLLECLLHDTPESLFLYLSLRSGIVSVLSDVQSAVSVVWDFRLIRSYYKSRSSIVNEEDPRILNNELVAYLAELLEMAIQELQSRDGEERATCNETFLSVFCGIPIERSGTRVGSGDSMDVS